MNNSDLLKLVKSLKKNEKRYVAMYLSKHRKENNLLELYKIICSDPFIDDTDLPKKNNDRIFLSQLNRNKYNLYHFILDALHQFDLRKSLYGRLLKMLHQSEILSNKGLFEAQADLLLKAYAIADENELSELKLEILRLQNPQIIQLKPAQKKFSELKKLTGNIIQNAQILLLNTKLINVFKGSGRRLTNTQNNYLKRNVLNISNRKKYRGNSFHDKYFYYGLFSYYYNSTGNESESNKIVMKAVKLFRQNPNMLKFQIWRNRYFNTLKRLSSTSFAVSKEKMYEFSNNEIKQLDVSEVRKITHDGNILNNYIESGEFRKGEFFLNTVESKFVHLKNQLDLYSQRILYLNFSLMNFGAGNYRKAYNMIDQNFDDKHKFGGDESLVAVARIIRLVILYELNRFDVLESQIRSAFHYVKKQKTFLKSDQVMINCIRKMIANPEKGKLKEIALQARTELLSDNNLKTTEQTLTYFDIISWLNSKIEGKTFAETVKQKWKKKSNLK